MAQPCKVCTHPEREQVDEALAAGLSDREGERRWGFSRAGVARHRKNHLSSAVQATAVEATKEAATTALARLEHLHRRVERVLTLAEREGKHTLVLQAAREMRQTAELLAKITGELDERTQVQVLNVSTDPQWLATRAAMLDALQPYPEAASAVAGRLLALEAGGTG